MWLSNFAVFVTELPVLKFHCTLKQHRIASSPTVLNFDILMQKTLQGFWFKTKISSSMTSAGVARPSHGLPWHFDFTFVKCNQNLYEYRVDIVNVISINTIWPRATDSWFDSCWMQFLTQCWDWQPDIRSSVHLCPGCHASIFWANQKISSPTMTNEKPRDRGLNVSLVIKLSFDWLHTTHHPWIWFLIILLRLIWILVTDADDQVTPVSVHPPLEWLFLALATISRQPVLFLFPWPNFHNH